MRHRFQKFALCVNALYDARQHGDIASAFSKVQERESANYKNAPCKKRFRALLIPISAFAKSENQRSQIRDHTLCKIQTQSVSNTVFGFSKSQTTNMKDHAVMKTSFLVRFCLPVTSESHTRHQLDQTFDEVTLRLPHRGAHRPQTYMSVN